MGDSCGSDHDMYALEITRSSLCQIIFNSVKFDVDLEDISFNKVCNSTNVSIYNDSMTTKSRGDFDVR